MGRRLVQISRRSALGIAAIVVVVATIGGGGYALFFGGGNGPAASVNSVNLSKGLVGWWRMDGNAKDSTPYGNNGTVNGATLTTDREGRANSAYSFNGTNATISSASSSFPTGSAPRSVFAWVYATKYATGGWQMVESYGTAASIGGGSALSIGSAGQISFNSELNDFSSSLVLPLNSWHYIGYTLSGTQVTIWYDNQSQVGTLGSAPNTPAGSTNWIGSWVSSTSYLWPGNIDDVRIYNRAVSSPEAQALYKQYSPSPKAAQGENGLVGWWKLNGNAKDSTPYGNNCVASGSPTLTTDRKGRQNSAYSFNGTSDYFSCCTLNAPAVNAPKTMEAWINVPGYPSTEYDMLVLRNGGSADQFRVASSGLLQVSQWGGAITVSGSTPVSINTWHLATYTYDGTTNGLYLDGALVATSTTASQTGSTTSTCIGSYCGSGFFNGSISDVRVYNRALSASEIAAQYNSYNSQICLGGCGQGINLQKGLVGYWPMDGNAKDATPYSNNGTVNGATLTTDRKARPNSAYAFNGTSYISSASPISTNVGTTIVLWVKTTACGSQEPFVSNRNPSGSVYFGCNNGGSLFFWGGNSGVSTSSTIVGNGQWHLVAASMASTTTTLYIDNQAAQSFAQTNIASSGIMQIGHDVSTGDYFNGSISDVRIYNRALSASEIQALYSSYQ